ncbi:MAG: hypothetical protein CMJ82_09820 [Planctomycetaceae bacterium]|nr:hypothetical protein [Planctomycetaceae bacterium]|tara:strand:+ start:509 stop:1369 length:861 start_codon:yes stop_codon:yes gene_type:complete
MLFRFLVANMLKTQAQDAVRNKVEEIVTDQVRNLEEMKQGREMPPCDVAIVFANHLEATGVVDQMEAVVSTQCVSFVEHAGRWRGRDVVVIEAGDTWRQVAKAVTDLINMHQPNWVVSAGFASSLCTEIRKGTIVMPGIIRDVKGRRLEVGLQLASDSRQRGLYTGDLVSTPELLETPSKRKKLAEESSAQVADMESAVVAEICRQAKQRCLAVRVVAEAFDEKPPELMSRILKQGTAAGKLGALSKGLFTQASQLKEMWDLKNEAYKTSERLADFLAGVVRQLRL